MFLEKTEFVLICSISKNFSFILGKNCLLFLSYKILLNKKNIYCYQTKRKLKVALLFYINTMLLSLTSFIY